MACMPDVSIVSHFKDLPDPRIERAKKHRLIDIIVIAPGSESGAGSGVHHGRRRRIPGHGTLWQKQTGVAAAIA